MQRLTTQLATMAITIEAMKTQLAQIERGPVDLAQIEEWGSMLNSDEKGSVLSYYTTMIDMFVNTYDRSEDDAW